jgi:DNA mismatch repair protein MutL
MKIQVLPDHVANQIAAGEVVERPASVVRELVDNAIDAGATEVTITLRAGGHSAIVVTDNGSGMQQEDAVLAFKRHATSKIQSLTDLDTLQTLGFRGEALPSIASVSMVRLRTRTRDSDKGLEVSLKAGEQTSLVAVAAPIGTEFEVAHLFFNTPARKKFQKTQRSEEMRIKQWLLHYAMGAPGVHFKLLFDDREILNLPRRASLVERAESLIRGSSVAIDLKVNGIRVEGVLAHPSQAHGEAHALAVLVNKRLISDRMILRAAKDGFGSSLKDREFPVGVISLEMDSRLVDVNVHPQKSEVRFKDSSQIYVSVLRAVQAAIADFKSPVQGSDTSRSGYAGGNAQRPNSFSRGNSFGAGRTEPSQVVWSGAAAAPSALPLEAMFARGREMGRGNGGGIDGPPAALRGESLFVGEQGAENGGMSTPQTEPSAAFPSQPFRFQSLRYLAQLLECYLLCEQGGRFVVVDMHAAHERYNYNVVRKALRERSSSAQRLLVPLEFTVSEQSAVHLEEHEPLLSSIGFELEVSPQGQVRVLQVPSLLVNRDVQNTLKQIGMVDPEEGGGAAAYEYLVDQIAARIACHASIRSGKVMTSEEAYALFELMDSSECSAACPHGRPVVVSFSQADVEHWFGRDR